MSLRVVFRNRGRGRGSARRQELEKQRVNGKERSVVKGRRQLLTRGASKSEKPIAVSEWRQQLSRWIRN
jgi:hypothetical protein